MRNLTGPGLTRKRLVLLSTVLIFTLTISSRHPAAGGPARAVRTDQFGRTEPQPVRHPEWSHNASIYEVNVRQYSTGGTFDEFAEHLPRLKEMGVGIIWFMPIHPIGERNRKGSLGSYYSVRDYLAVNPEFGTIDDFKSLVGKIHDMGMHVIIDWVANHCAWDNPLTVEHPDWFTKDVYGNFVPPNPDWSDVVDFDYSSPALRRYMIDAMKFWVEDMDVDGFRCDVAGMVPMDFWNQARAELDEIKPVFMLAEWESPQHHEYAFDMTYAWDLYRLMNQLAGRSLPTSAIGIYLEREAATYPEDAYRMYFTSNHDVNSWEGTVYERLGDGVEAFAVLAGTLGGMPLVYSGQEAGLDRRLEFFEKDQIDWKAHPLGEVYTVLLDLKRDNRALWNGAQGGDVTVVHTSNDGAVFAFVKETKGDRVLIVLNLSDTEQEVELLGKAFEGDYRLVLPRADAREVHFSGGETVTLPPWGYRVYAARDLDLVLSMMTGSFTSCEQAEADTNYFDVHLEMVPIWPQRTDGYWLYVEQALAGRPEHPYRQRVYHLTAEEDGTIRSDVFVIPDPLRFAGESKAKYPLEVLTPDSLIVKKGCAVILKRKGPGVFEGGAVADGCMSDLRGASYATSEVRLTSEELITWDRGFDEHGNQVWGVTGGGYIFKKTR